MNKPLFERDESVLLNVSDEVRVDRIRKGPVDGVPCYQVICTRLDGAHAGETIDMDVPDEIGQVMVNSNVSRLKAEALAAVDRSVRRVRWFAYYQLTALRHYC